MGLRPSECRMLSTCPRRPSRADDVDFRYSESCLMLLLDGHIDNPGPWSSLAHLQGELRFNISNPLSSTP